MQTSAITMPYITNTVHLNININNKPSDIKKLIVVNSFFMDILNNMVVKYLTTSTEFLKRVNDRLGQD